MNTSLTQTQQNRNDKGIGGTISVYSEMYASEEVFMLMCPSSVCLDLSHSCLINS